MSADSLDSLNAILALVEGQFLAAAEEATVHDGEPSWMANHEVAFFAFWLGFGRLGGTPDYASALIVLRRLAPLVGEFIDESKDMEPWWRLDIVNRYLAMCERIGDLTLLWGVDDHPHRVIIEMHRRAEKLKRSM